MGAQGMLIYTAVGKKGLIGEDCCVGFTAVPARVLCIPM